MFVCMTTPLGWLHTATDTCRQVPALHSWFQAAELGQPRDGAHEGLAGGMPGAGGLQQLCVHVVVTVAADLAAMCPLDVTMAMA
jgi:hypothetical protein